MGVVATPGPECDYANIGKSIRGMASEHFARFEQEGAAGRGAAKSAKAKPATPARKARK